MAEQTVAAKLLNLQSCIDDAGGLLERADALCHRTAMYADYLMGSAPTPTADSGTKPTEPSSLIHRLNERLRRLNAIFETTTEQLNRIENAIGPQTLR